MRRVVAAFAVVTGLLLLAADANAAQCSISTTPVAFGSYNVFVAAPLDSLGVVVYNCNGGAKVIAITMSQGRARAFAPRRLFKGTEPLEYNLYRDPSRTVIWGDGTRGTSLYISTSIPNKTDVSVPVYGRVTAAQDVTAGAYADSVSVMINF